MKPVHTKQQLRDTTHQLKSHNSQTQQSTHHNSFKKKKLKRSEGRGQRANRLRQSNRAKDLRRRSSSSSKSPDLRRSSSSNSLRSRTTAAVMKIGGTDEVERRKSEVKI